MKMENRSPKRSHKLDGIAVGRIRTNQSQDPESSNVVTGLPFYSSASASDSSDEVISGMGVLLGLIFTRSYRSTLLIATLSTTLSLVKTSLKGMVEVMY